MKNWVIGLIVLCFTVSGLPCLAYESKTTIINNVEAVKNNSQAGILLDAPMLVTKGDWSLGVTGGKTVLADVFQEDSRELLEDDKGWFGFLKITYWGTWFDFDR